jgi:hypothetical protein
LSTFKDEEREEGRISRKIGNGNIQMKKRKTGG